MSRRLAETTSRFLARRSPRRGFLSKTAVVGSALAVAPRNFITRPGTAYAQVCNCSGSSCSCSSLCCDGYTEFCCTVYGTNGCPPGSLYGGWWRVSQSSYCNGNNRYYLDCHNPCGRCGCGASGICSGACNGTPCGCALGSCRNRKAGCTHFRYGQCNRHVDCLGPIVCRVVTCTPPWQLEPNCSRSVRTDEATRNHNRACLTQQGRPPAGALERARAGDGTIRVRGWALDPDADGPIDVLIYVNGELATSAVADRPRPDVGVAYRGQGDRHGFDVTIPATLGTKEVCVYAVNVGGGTNPLLGCDTVRVQGVAPTGVLEAVEALDGSVSASGWAMVPGAAHPVEVELVVDGVVLATVTADLPRPDLVHMEGAAGQNHGFAAVLDTSGDVAEVCARAVDPVTGEVGRLGCSTVRARPPASVHGAVDRVRTRADGIRVVGWALDPDGGDVEVAVFLDGREAVRVPAEIERPDVALAHPAAEHTGGFDVVVSAGPGDHRVCVYGFGRGDWDARILLGCVAVTVE